MKLIWIALRSIQQRGVSSGLTIFSMALGVMLVILVLTIHGVVEHSFQTNSSLGYNVLVGAKGGQEQLVLNMVFFNAKVVENVPYKFYLEFQQKAYRDHEIENSYAYREWLTKQAAYELLASSSADGGSAGIAQRQLAAADLNRARTALDMGRDGKYAPYCQLVIPLCLGDFFDRFRVVGTTPDYFDKLVYDMVNGKKYEFAQGRNFVHDDPEHGFFEAVVGANVAREKNVKIGDKINPRHGAPDGHTHERPFTVVGILKPSGTPNDRAVFVNMEGFYLMEDHAKPLEEQTVTGETATSDEADEMTPEEKQAAAEARKKAKEEAEEHAGSSQSLAGIPPLPMEQREITGMLILTSNPLFAPGLKNSINEGKDGQVVFPVEVIYNLFDNIINPVRTAFMILTGIICFVSGLSILISIYNSMSERRHEIAVMRALGAGRETVFQIILMESALLALLGGFIGWLLGHVGCVLASGAVEYRTGVSIGFFNREPSVQPLVWLGAKTEWAANVTMPAELLIVPALLILAIVVGFWPAVSAYRTDVAQSLGK
jgi:putative ABC transport system permease protein